MLRFLVFLLLILTTGCSSLSRYFTPDRLALHSGFGTCEIKGEDIRCVPSAIRFELNVNETYLNRKYGRLNFGLEVFGLSVIQPELNKIIGLTPILRYYYPIHPSLDIYIEGGAGPIYLGLDTYEQEESGFSFYDQAGLGIEWRLHPRVAMIFGYRFSHVSHGNILKTRNRGIEGDTVIFGFSFSLGP